MKQCPLCRQTYTDSAINFCLNDGELLSYLSEDPPPTLFSDKPLPTQFADDAPPTLLMNKARVTYQTNWQSSSPQEGWQSPVQYNPQGFSRYAASQDQTLATISFVLGLASLVMVCCFGGIWLGLPAAIVGFLGMRNAENDPDRYGGRGLAVAGMVIGIVTFLISIVHIIYLVLVS